MSSSKKKKPYLTKRILVSKSKSAFQEASKNAMKIVGYVVVVKDGWVVKEYEDGTIKRLEPL